MTERIGRHQSKKEERLPHGLSLLQRFEEPKTISRIAWSTDGGKIAASFYDGSVAILDVERGGKSITLEWAEEKPSVCNVAWSSDGKWLACGDAYQVRLYSVNTWSVVRTLAARGWGLSWSPDSNLLVTQGESGTDLITIWEVSSGTVINSFSHPGIVFLHGSAWSPDGTILATTSDVEIQLWNREAWNEARVLSGHTKQVNALAWSPRGDLLVSAGDDHVVMVWKTKNWKPEKLLEGHTGDITNLSFSFDGRFLVSKSNDGSYRMWRCDRWQEVAIITVKDDRGRPWPGGGLSCHPFQNTIAILDDEEKVLKILDVNLDGELGSRAIEDSVQYTTAKLVLVGEAGVGKTGLGWRLKYGKYKEHSSTHGQQFWVIDELGKTLPDGTECEAVLWDLAGQPDYRLVHALYLDDVDLALVLFDPTNRQEVLAGVEFWLSQLRLPDQTLRHAILVGTRIDRGTSTLTDEEIMAYCRRKCVSGGYVATSARKGEGLAELIARLKEQIPWSDMTATVTTRTFKWIKEYVLSLKEVDERPGVLVSPDALRERLMILEPNWHFTNAEMMTAARHLETHGYVTILRSSKGQVFILLAPELLTNLASSFVLEARRNPRGLGFLEENRLLRREYSFPELKGLKAQEQEVLLDVVSVLFLQHNVCFRETFNDQTFLVFPALINEKPPMDKALEVVEDLAYRVRGAIENTYASLVVLLGYTNTFNRTNQWQNQAQYEMGKGDVCGFRLTDQHDGEIELVLYYARNTPEYVKSLFQGLFERFLSRGGLEILRQRPVDCPRCGKGLARNVVTERLQEGFSFCNNCGHRLILPSPETLRPLARNEERQVGEEQHVVLRRTAFEAALTRLQAILRDREEEQKSGKGSPTCFISYAWGVPEHEQWVLRFARDMRNARVDVLLDRWHNLPGTSLSRFIDRVESSDYVVVVGTPKLREKYDTQASDPVVASELRLINTRLRQPGKYGPTVIPLLLSGSSSTAFTPFLQDLVSISFREEEMYFVRLFELIWRLYNLPSDHPLLEELRSSMVPAEQALRESTLQRRRPAG
ncbi:MAG TPA: TIR domain-containing protein [Thermoanaerobaculia bacterium]|nr:TIR domain-containing protein [Thermoanaerobaculia bacterium]